MLCAHAVMDAVGPSLQITKDEVDHRHELFGDFVVAAFGYRMVIVASLAYLVQMPPPYSKGRGVATEIACRTSGMLIKTVQLSIDNYWQPPCSCGSLIEVPQAIRIAFKCRYRMNRYPCLPAIDFGAKPGNFGFRLGRHRPPYFSMWHIGGAPSVATLS